MLRLFAFVLASLLLSPLYAAGSECKKPSLFGADYEKSEEGISLYFSDWIDYENCMIEDIQNSENFLDFRDRFKEFYIAHLTILSHLMNGTLISSVKDLITKIWIIVMKGIC